MSTTAQTGDAPRTGVGSDHERRAGVAVLGTAGALFVAYPALRPAGDTLAAMSTTAWPVSHLCGMAGFVMLVVGLGVLQNQVPRSASRWALLLGGLGVAAMLPYYGAEAFALHAAGRLALERPGTAAALAPLPDAFRLAPVAGTVFLVGLLGLGAAGVLAALALWRAWRSRAGVLLAAGAVLFLPQFFAPVWGRIAHGVLLGAGCVAVAVTIARSPQPRPESRP